MTWKDILRKYDIKDWADQPNPDWSQLHDDEYDEDPTDEAWFSDDYYYWETFTNLEKLKSAGITKDSKNEQIDNVLKEAMIEYNEKNKYWEGEYEPHEFFILHPYDEYDWEIRWYLDDRKLIREADKETGDAEFDPVNGTKSAKDFFGDSYTLMGEMVQEYIEFRKKEGFVG